VAGELEGVRVAFLVANEGVERSELTEPWDAVGAAGGESVLVAPEAGDVELFDISTGSRAGRPPRPPAS